MVSFRKFFPGKIEEALGLQSSQSKPEKVLGFNFVQVATTCSMYYFGYIKETKQFCPLRS